MGTRAINAVPGNSVQFLFRGPNSEIIEENCLNVSWRRAGTLIVSVPLFVSLCMLAGCNRGQTGSDVMAKVNGRKITRSEVDKYYQNQTAGSSQPLSPEQVSSFKLSILRNLVDNELMMQRAEK